MNAPAARRQSTFVTALAIVMLVFNGLGVVGSLLQNAAINVMLPALVTSQGDAGLAMPEPPMALLRTLGVIGFVFSLLMVWSSWALLQRREWARRMYVSLFVIGIVFNVLGAVAFWAGSRMLDPTMLGGTPFPAQARAILQGMTVFVAILVVVLSVLYAWIARRLASPQVKAEFAAAGDGR